MSTPPDPADEAWFVQRTDDSEQVVSRLDWDVDAREQAAGYDPQLDVPRPVCDGDGWLHLRCYPFGHHLPDEPWGRCEPCPGCVDC